MEHFIHTNLDIDGVQIHTATAGSPSSKHTLLLLHGWPEDWSAYQAIMKLASNDCYVVAVDLPGIGGSTTMLDSGVKSHIAPYIDTVATRMKLENVTLVGHDIGGMVAYACLRMQPQWLSRACIMSVVIPGLNPWQSVITNPYIWHFAFHSIPELPETLVTGKQAEYFEFFYNVVTAEPAKITAEAKVHYIASYASSSALKTGFDWYRGLAQDAKENERQHDEISTPLLYIRGEKESGDMKDYMEGFNSAGIANVTNATVPKSGHFMAEEQPEALWQVLKPFVFNS